MSDLNQMIDTAQKFGSTQQMASIEQDNVEKAAFALNLMNRIPQEPPKPEEPPRIPSLGALAIPN